MIKKIWSYIKIIMTFLILFYVSYIIFTFTYYPKKMQKFCDSTTIGESIEESKRNADTNNFSYRLNRESKTLMVHDTKTMGTSTCLISYDMDNKVYDKSYMGD